MPTKFDAFARILADDLTRRSALGRIGAGFSLLLFGSACDSGSDPVAATPREVQTLTLSARKAGKGCKCGGQGQVCFQGSCTCPPGKQVCGKKDDCVDYCGGGQVLDDNCSCVDFCGPGESYCGGSCVDAYCVPPEVFNPDTCQCECPQGTTDCSGTCVDLLTNVDNCGACDQVCPALPGGTVACVSGTCVGVCGPGWANCDGDTGTGCETDITTVENCGACGATCFPYNVCSGGQCVSVCTSDADCVQGFFCSTSWTCEAKKQDGQPCLTPSECESGTCLDGICA